MHLRVLGCSGGSAPGRCLSGYLLDGRVVVDAGALTTGIGFEQQAEVEAVLITHAHLDHVWSFPFFLANRFTHRPTTTALWGSPTAVDAVRTHLFNDAVWPHYERFVVDGVPLVRFHTVDDGATAAFLPGWEVTTEPVHHTIPTQALLVRHGDRSVLFCGDSGPTERAWVLANAQDDLGAVVVECSFPDRMRDLAVLTGHLTPSLLRDEVAKLERDVPVLVTHVKPDEREEVLQELFGLGDERLHLLEDRQTFDL